MGHLVHAIGHIKINTNVMDAMVRESTELLGLHVTHSDQGQTWLSSNGRAAELVLLNSSENATHTIGLEALTVDAVREAEGRVAGAGCEVLTSEPSMPCMAAGFTFATPQGVRFEIHTPIRDAMYSRRRPTNGVGPNRMDHINFISPEPAETRNHLEAIGGLKLSERMVNDSLSWMYAGNRQHHILGVVKGTAPGLHHYSFEFLDFSQYMRLGDIMDRFDKQLMWGPGRHRPGDNLYAYYQDACGAMVECSSGMALVADDTVFEANVITNLARPGNVRVMNVWGPPAPLEWREFFFPFTAIA